jgi:thiol-disulfide isomerase/thioredoxin
VRGHRRHGTARGPGGAARPAGASESDRRDRRRGGRFVAALGALALAGGGCGRAEGGGAEPVGATSSSVASAGRRGVELVAAPPGGEPVEALVRREAERARANGRTLLVYLGAPWCEPCQRFHDAARAGTLDAELPGVTLLEFDHERDGDRLRAAGYAWHYVPLFARPGPDGRASGRAIEGSIKGEGAVAQIVPRLRGLLAP